MALEGLGSRIATMGSFQDRAPPVLVPSMQGATFRASALGFRVWGLEFRVWGLIRV